MKSTEIDECLYHKRVGGGGVLRDKLLNFEVVLYCPA